MNCTECKPCKYSKMIIKRLNLNENSLVLEIASNDGYLLKKSTANLRSKHLYFNKGITWSAVSSKNFSSRYFGNGKSANWCLRRS